MQLLQIDYVKLRKDYNFLLKIRLVFATCTSMALFTPSIGSVTAIALTRP